jgi:chemotaxis protein MotB
MHRLPIEDDRPSAAPAWVLPYGDLMSLLLACFVLLVSMSEIREDKNFQAMADSLHQRFGAGASAASLFGGSGKAENSALGKQAGLGRARRAAAIHAGDQLCPALGAELRSTSQHDAPEAPGGALFFDPQSTALTEDNRQILRAICRKIEPRPGRIEIRTFASPGRPASDSQDKSPWELAYARGSATMEYLLELGIHPARIRLAVSADSAPGRWRGGSQLSVENPRVEVLVLRTSP